MTLLFTDIEASTQLWERAPDMMEAALERHDAIVRAAIDSAGGYIFKTMGDAFCVAFATCPAAIEAAIAAQSALQGEPWPIGAEIRARMALHTGTCQERDGDYFGPTVNRVARLLAIASGAQVILSGATAELLSDLSRDVATLRDLGPHRLKDLGRPERVFQLEARGIESNLAPLRSLDNPELPNNLPTLLSSFVGREHEVEEVRSLIGASRLVTLTGSGGSGKTRLAVQTAAELLDGKGEGVWLIELACVADEEQVPGAIASVLGMKESGEATALECVVDALAEQDVLLILDNCEHVVGTCAKFAELVIRHCPRVHILATSREPLGVDGERVYRVPSLAVPGDDVETLEEVERYDAIELFASRAADAGYVVGDEDAATVVAICRRLDGIPLALELAAARLSSMSPRQLHDRLDQRFRLLTGGSRHAMARQQTLQAMVDWSYGMLGRPEQSVLQRLSVFLGGFELEAAESVCSSAEVDEFDVVNILHSLVDKSLVVAEQGHANVRFRTLETIRQYGAQKLLETEGDDSVLAVRDRHAAFFLALVEQFRDGAGCGGAEEVAWYRRVDVEIDNLRAMVAHLSETPGRERELLDCALALEFYIGLWGRVELVPPVLAALERFDEAPSAFLAEATLMCAGMVDGFYGFESMQRERSVGLFNRALDMARQVGATGVEAMALAMQSTRVGRERRFDEATAMADEALGLAREAGDPMVLERTLFMSSLALVSQVGAEERHRRASLLHEVHDVARHRDDRLMLAVALQHLAYVDLDEGRLDSAKARASESLAYFEELGAQDAFQLARSQFLYIPVLLGEFDAIAPQLRASLRWARRVGPRVPVADMILVAATCATARGDSLVAATLYGARIRLGAEAQSAGRLFKSEKEKSMEDADLATLREHLGDEAFERAFAIGGEFSSAQACEFALGH